MRCIRPPLIVIKLRGAVPAYDSARLSRLLRRLVAAWQLLMISASVTPYWEMMPLTLPTSCSKLALS